MSKVDYCKFDISAQISKKQTSFVGCVYMLKRNSGMVY